MTRGRFEFEKLEVRCVCDAATLQFWRANPRETSQRVTCLVCRAEVTLSCEGMQFHLEQVLYVVGRKERGREAGERDA